jgi:hypothetical protein
VDGVPSRGFWFSYGWTDRGWGIAGVGAVPGSLGGPVDPQGGGSAASARSDRDFMPAALKQAFAAAAEQSGPSQGDLESPIEGRCLALRFRVCVHNNSFSGLIFVFR